MKDDNASNLVTICQGGKEYIVSRLRLQECAKISIDEAGVLWFDDSP